MKRKLAIIVVMVLSIVLAFPSVVSAAYDHGYITLDDGTTSLHFYDAGPSWDAHVPTGAADHDYWDLTIATSGNAVVQIEWFDWYPTNDVYEIWVDGTLLGINAAGAHGVEDITLNTGATYSIEVRWIYYKTNQAPIAGGSYYDITFTVTNQIPVVIQVDIDIKPGSDPNSINPKSKGKIPVAILSTADFDAPNEVDKGSLTFGRTGDEDSLAFCTKSAEDVNGDGLLDQVCHFNTQLTGFQVGDTEGILTGQTVDGTPIYGKDTVNIVPKGK